MKTKMYFCDGVGFHATYHVNLVDFHNYEVGANEQKVYEYHDEDHEDVPHFLLKV